MNIAVDLKKTYESGKYTDLVQALKKNKQNTSESNYYKGLVSQRGLGGEIQNLETAKDFYNKAFLDGSIESGLALAKIYEKDGDYKQAEKIYSDIINNKKTEPEQVGESEELAYAHYRLGRIGLKTNQISDNETKEHLIAAQQIYAKNVPNSIAHVKASYYLGIYYYPGVTSQSDIAEAKKFFSISANQNYQPAIIALDCINLNNTVIQIEKQFSDDWFEKIKKSINSYIILDKKNLPARLLNDKLLDLELRKKNLNADQQTEIMQQRLENAKEILAFNPENKIAKKSTEGLNKILVDEFIQSATANFTKEINTLNTKGTYFGKRANENFVGIISDNLSSKLSAVTATSSEYLNQLDFNNKAGKAKSFAEDFIKSNEKQITEILDKPSTLQSGIGELKEKLLKTIIVEREKIETKNNNILIKDFLAEDTQYFDKREKFKEEISNNFMNTYSAFLEATKKEGAVVGLIVDDGVPGKFLKGAQTVLPIYSAFLGPILGKQSESAIAGVAAGLAADKLHEYNLEQAKKAATEFCKIGNRNPKEAEKIFSSVAEELAKTYGMQIDNLENTKINEFSEFAVKKMLKNVASEPSFLMQMTQTITGTNLDNFADNIEAKLLDGISGKAEIEDVNLAHNEETKGWTANGILTETGVTNGSAFLSRNENPTGYKRYGFCYQKTPQYSKGLTDVKSDLRKDNIDDFVRHETLLEKTDALKKNELIINSPNFFDNIDPNQSEKSNLDRKKMFGLVTLQLGVTIFLAAALIATAVAVGLAAPALIPVAVVAGAAGFVMLKQGLKQAREATKDLSNLANKQQANTLVKERNLEISQNRDNKESAVTKNKDKKKVRKTKFTDKYQKIKKDSTHAEKHLNRKVLTGFFQNKSR